MAGGVDGAGELLSYCHFTLDVLGATVGFSPAQRRGTGRNGPSILLPCLLGFLCCLGIVTGLWGIADNQSLGLCVGCLQASIQITGPVVILLTHGRGGGKDAR